MDNGLTIAPLTNIFAIPLPVFSNEATKSCKTSLAASSSCYLMIILSFCSMFIISKKFYTFLRSSSCSFLLKCFLTKTFKVPWSNASSLSFDNDFFFFLKIEFNKCVDTVLRFMNMAYYKCHTLMLPGAIWSGFKPHGSLSFSAIIST